MEPCQKQSSLAFSSYDSGGVEAKVYSTKEETKKRLKKTKGLAINR